MSDWTSGYVSDIGYTYGYYGELSPLRAAWVMATRGIGVSSEFGTQAMNACELGFGQGVSLNMHAAATQGRWWGTDFNPAQVAFATDLARSHDGALKVFDDSFEEFCNRPDLPEFDFVSLHGIWSWISEENRKVLVDFFRRKLKVGGVVYVSYNALPGWASGLPMRHLLAQHSTRMSAQGAGAASRVDNAIEFAEQLFELKPKYLLANPSVSDRLAKVSEHGRNYLAHEYFNRDWLPMFFADVAQTLGSAKLSYAGSAHYFDCVDPLNFTAPQQKFLAEIADQNLRETARDYCTNTQFRRDYWVRGPVELSPFRAVENVRAKRFVIAQARNEIKMKVAGGLGETELVAGLYQPVIDYLANSGPKTFAEIERAIAKDGVNFAQLKEILTVLCGSGAVLPAQEDAVVAKVRPSTNKLNAKLIDLSRSSNEIPWLTSPVTGGGIVLSRFHQMFIGAKNAGQKSPEEWVATAWSILRAQNQRIRKEGKVLESDEENLAELNREAKRFTDEQMPLLKTLGIL